MNVTTKKLAAGRYAVFVDGAETNLVIEKGDAPKFRCRQEWQICVRRGHDDLRPLTFDQASLEGAVNTIRTILLAAPALAQKAA